jgi:nanoRNase/pAp phosphatase (c-di-AMP/oligoRNAs hydrolase)
MDEKTQKQIMETIEAASSVALVLPQSPTFDAAATVVALFRMLSAAGKTVSILSVDPIPEQLTFLSQGVVLQQALTASGALEVWVSTKQAKLDQLSYQVADDSIRIYLTAKEGSFVPTDVVAHQSAAGCDLLIIVGAASLEDLGSVYNSQVDLFFNTPKLVIDTNPDNSYYGTHHLVDVTASSVGEVVASMVVTEKPQWINEQAATALLAAITANTQSFQSIKTTPHALALASELVSRGANQQDVVLHLYKTKPFSLLKLWGRALARAQFIDQSSFLYSVLTQADYAKTVTSIAMAESVLLELLDNSASAHTIALLAESEDGVRVYIATMPHIQQQLLLDAIGGRILAKRQVKGLYALAIIQLAVTDVQQAEQALLVTVSQQSPV